MEVILAIVIGLLYTVGVYLLLRRSIVKLILGIIFVSNATNLLIFVAAGLTKNGQPSFLNKETGLPPESMSDPLPQAMILTAIVIGFGVVAFSLTLMYKYYQATGKGDVDQIQQIH